jgi:hypothetical protein
LNNVIESDLKDELKLYKKFELLNDEKITPYFMSLTKLPDSNATLMNILNDNGVNFLIKKIKTIILQSITRMCTNAGSMSTAVLTLFTTFLEKWPAIMM